MRGAGTATASTRLPVLLSPDWPRLCRVGRALHLQGQAREDRVAGRGRNLGVSPGVLCCHTGDLCSLGTHLSHASVLPRFSTRWSRRRRPSGGACLAPLALAAPVPDAPPFRVLATRDVFDALAPAVERTGVCIRRVHYLYRDNGAVPGDVEVGDAPFCLPTPLLCDFDHTCRAHQQRPHWLRAVREYRCVATPG